MKKVIKVVSVILVILVIAGFFIIKNLTETKDGKLNMYVAANLQLYK
ncbi:lipase/esterase, partial [Clostridium botulinum CFSAN001627]